MARSTALQEQMVELSGQGGKGEGKGRKRECTCMLGIKDPTVPFKAHPLHSGPPYKLSYFPTTLGNKPSVHEPLGDSRSKH